MAMAAMEIPMAIKRFGRPGVEISVFCGKALIMSRNSSSDPSMMERLTSVTDFLIEWFIVLSQSLVVNSGDGLFGVKNGREVERDSYVDVRRGGCIFANVFEK